MTVTRIHASREYDVVTGSGLLPSLPDYLERVPDLRHLKTGAGATGVFVVSDDTVFALYGECLTEALSEAGYRVRSFVFPHGEEQKTLATYAKLTEALCRADMTRTDFLIALGGGVTGDLTGFAAATYRRGIPFVQIPTTLLAAVDASVGGKTGVDLPSGKNQVGCFWQPHLVLCDTDVFRTLPDTEYRNGCAEIIKYAMLDDPDLFNGLEAKPVSAFYEEAVTACVQKKRFYVERDERDTGMRQMLNFGHTLGHALERISGYTVPHGEAVAVGMAVLTRASAAYGLCGADTADRLTRLIRRYGLPVETDFTASELAEAAQADKKASGDSVTLILPRDIGACHPETVLRRSLADWFRAGGCR